MGMILNYPAYSILLYNNDANMNFKITNAHMHVRTHTQTNTNYRVIHVIASIKQF